ncbi:MAG: hypothetical protein LIO80_02505 [Lachnospiraceae bacterium]|nr:hypothetical protein [Lachnospiraceae bacterium]
MKELAFFLQGYDTDGFVVPLQFFSLKSSDSRGCAVIVGIAGMWARTLTVTRTTVAVQAAEEDEIPEEYGFVDGNTENNGTDDYYVSLCNGVLQELPEWLLEQFEDSGWTIMADEIAPTL